MKAMKMMLRALSCSMLALTMWCAHAGPVPWGAKTIDRMYEQKDLRDLLRELAASQNIVANIDAGVPAINVSGRFNMSAGQLFQYLSSTHGLVHYYAGNVLYVFPASASVTEVLQVRPDEIPRVMQALKDFKLVDPQYPIKVNQREGVLLVSGPRVYVDMVRRMTKTTTPVSEAAPVEVRVFPLKYASAADQVLRRGGRDLVTPGVVSVLRQVFARGAPAAPDRRDASKMREAFARPQEPATARVANSDIELRLPPRMPTPQEVAGSDSTPSPEPAADRQTTLPHIVADSRLNAVVVRDLVSRMHEHENLVRTLDIRQAAVEIEVSVIEVSSNDLSALGMDWRFHSSRVDLRSGRRDLPDERFPSSLPPASGGTYDPGPVLRAAAGMGGVLTTVLTDGGRQFLSRINVLSSDGKASFRASPKVLTLNNAEAVLERLKTFFVRVPGAYQSQLYDVSVGTSMSVVPTLVDESGETQIRLAVKIDDGEVSSQSVDGIPVITRNSIGTQAYVAMGQSLLIAGYKEDATGQTESGVPGLSKVPVVGWLFKQQEGTGSQLERLYMITPRVLQSDAAESAAPQKLGAATSRAPTRVSLAERAYGYKVPRDLEP